MALNQIEWYGKLKSWLPSWVFTEEESQKAHLQALAKLLATVQQDASDHVFETFLTKSSFEFLNQHGSERIQTRLQDEDNQSFVNRIQRIVNKSNIVALKELVDALLITGESTFSENDEVHAYLDSGYFLNRGNLINDKRLRHFYVFIPPQFPAPDAFFDTGSFLGSREFFGTGESLATGPMFDNIFETINQARAAGVSFTLIEQEQG